MPRFFGRRKDTAIPAGSEPEHVLDRAALYADKVPASARSREMQRFLPPTPDDVDPDAPDEDVEFIASLVREIDRKPPAAPRAQLAPQEFTERVIMAATEEEKLNVFRSMQDEPPRLRDTLASTMQDVEMDDLLETLSTTAAALRLRKAA